MVKRVVVVIYMLFISLQTAFLNFLNNALESTGILTNRMLLLTRMMLTVIHYN